MDRDLLSEIKTHEDWNKTLLENLQERTAERDRLRKTLQEIKEELEYDISNGKVALDLALAALEDK